MAGIPGWQRAVLKAINAPPTQSNLRFLDLWQRAEGGTAAANPLNTTQPAAGATDYNSVHVKNYPDPITGIGATAKTLLNGRYGPIVEGLRGGASLVELARAVAASPWGTGGGVLRLLGQDVPAPAAPAATGTVSPPSGGLSLQPDVAQPKFALSSALAGVLKANNDLIGIPSIDVNALTAAAATATPKAERAPSVRGMSAVKIASTFLGVPYVWGGESPKGFDCSGLLQYVWSQKGVNIPRTTYDQWQTGQHVDANNLQAGDAVFFRGSDPRGDLPGHVGIYLGAGKFIESPHTGATVRISSLSRRTDYAGARRYG